MAHHHKTGADVQNDEDDGLDTRAEEFREFAKYVEDNLRTQVDRERAQSGQEAVDFLTELSDSPDVLADKVRQLAALVRGAAHFVIYSGIFSFSFGTDLVPPPPLPPV